MAKLKGAFQFTGKHKQSGQQFKSGKSGIHGQALPKPGVHKNEKALKKNYNATDGVNKLAGEINTVFKFYAAESISVGKYTKLLSLFFKCPESERLWRLKLLEGMDVHDRKRLPLLMHVHPAVLTVKKNKITIPLEIMQHPENETGRNKYYFFYQRMILVTWNGKDDTYFHQTKRTPWVSFGDELPLRCVLEFDKPADSAEWLLLLSLVRGEERGEDRLPPDKVIMILKAGSFDAKQTARYDAWLVAERNKEKKPMRKSADEDVAEWEKVVKKRGGKKG